MWPCSRFLLIDEGATMLVKIRMMWVFSSEAVGWRFFLEHERAFWQNYSQHWSGSSLDKDGPYHGVQWGDILLFSMCTTNTLYSTNTSGNMDNRGSSHWRKLSRNSTYFLMMRRHYCHFNSNGQLWRFHQFYAFQYEEVQCSCQQLMSGVVKDCDVVAVALVTKLNVDCKDSQMPETIPTIFIIMSGSACGANYCSEVLWRMVTLFVLHVTVFERVRS